LLGFGVPARAGGAIAGRRCGCSGGTLAGPLRPIVSTVLKLTIPYAADPVFHVHMITCPRCWALVLADRDHQAWHRSGPGPDIPARSS
jgi:hypothetical protein